MTRERTCGICRICGLERELTYEHVPPRCAFNDQRARMYSLEQWVVLQSGGPARYRDQQRGSGYVTLCSECNNRRGGAWNAREFCKWTKMARGLIRRFPSGRRVESATFRTHSLEPLPFSKQIVSMILALNLPTFGTTYPALREFVLDRDRTSLPDDHHVYLSLCDLGFARWVGQYAFMGQTLDGNIESVAASELSYFPFTYVLAIGARLQHGALTDITAFTRRRRGEVLDDEMTLAVNGSFLPFDIP